MGLFDRQKKEPRKVVKKPAPAKPRVGVSRIERDIIVHKEGEVGDYKLLLTKSPTQDPQIKGILDKNPSLNCLVTKQYEVFAVKPKLQSSPAQALNHIVALCKRQAKGSPVELFYISESIFQSYHEGLSKAQNTGLAMLDNEKINQLFLEAIRQKASDIHVRYRESEAIILFRVNQLLRPHEIVEASTAKRIITAMFNTTKGGKDFSMQQSIDTSFKYNTEAGAEYMVRANSSPEKRGVTVVSRIRNTKELLPLEVAGYTPNQLAHLRQITDKHQGLLLITGPTNSGKSTTLTTIMAHIPREYAVCEVADPIEVVLPNVSHFEVANDNDKEMDRVMKDMVRQDPDYLIVGEIRSQQTAHAATSLAYAGTSVMTTMHTNSVAAAFPRAIKLGMERDDLSVEGFLNGVVSQNLVPILCDKCKRTFMKKPNMSIDDNKKKTDHYGLIFEGHQVYYRNFDGCSACRNSGVKDITLIAEVLEMNKDVRKLVAKKEYYVLGEYMEDQGIYTKHSHAAYKVMQGMFDPTLVEDKIDPFKRADVDAALRAGVVNA
ncbi:MAG: ATPase, T2SS/T4P/T4SS family [Pseudomonadota bacterium]